jgi:hypothetical protein
MTLIQNPQFSGKVRQSTFCNDYKVTPNFPAIQSQTNSIQYMCTYEWKNI